MPAPVRRLFETEASPDRTCLQTIQFVHHMLIPPGGRHVAELHIHPDAEELVVITRGRGTATIGDQTHAVELSLGAGPALAAIAQAARPEKPDQLGPVLPAAGLLCAAATLLSPVSECALRRHASEVRAV